MVLTKLYGLEGTAVTKSVQFFKVTKHIACIPTTEMSFPKGKFATNAQCNGQTTTVGRRTVTTLLTEIQPVRPGGVSVLGQVRAPPH